MYVVGYRKECNCNVRSYRCYWCVSVMRAQTYIYMKHTSGAGAPSQTFLSFLHFYRLHLYLLRLEIPFSIARCDCLYAPTTETWGPSVPSKLKLPSPHAIIRSNCLHDLRCNPTIFPTNSINTSFHFPRFSIQSNAVERSGKLVGCLKCTLNEIRNIVLKDMMSSRTFSKVPHTFQACIFIRCIILRKRRHQQGGQVFRTQLRTWPASAIESFSLIVATSDPANWERIFYRKARSNVW